MASNTADEYRCVARNVLSVLVAVATTVALVLAAAHPSAASESTDPRLYRHPVTAVVVDGFRPPLHFGGQGNRGYEYATTGGDPVRASAAGVVAFAGRIGGEFYLSIDHPDGLRTTYSHLVLISVKRGDRVAAGDLVGRAAAGFHFGVRRGLEYVDPSTVLGPKAPPTGRVLIEVRLIG